MKKIIIGSISIGLILIIGIATAILAIVPTGLNNVIDKPNEVTIVYSKTKDLSPEALTYRDRDSKDADVISNIYSIFCHAFEQKTLSAIFNGEINKNIEEHYLDKGSESVKSNSTSEDKITICFKYTNKHKIKGFEYKYLFFEITNSNERQENVFGVSSSFSVDNSYYSYNYYYSGKSNFSKLFNYIESLV